MRTAVAHYGRLDLLVNNAGLGGFRAEDEPVESFAAAVDLNLTSVSACAGSP